MNDFDFVIGTLKKDLTLENLRNEDLLSRVKKSFQALPNGMVPSHLLFDGKPGIFFCSKNHQIYVDCISIVQTDRTVSDRFIIDVRVYRTQFDPTEFSYRVDTFSFYRATGKQQDALNDKGRSRVIAASKCARNCIKSLVKEDSFGQMVERIRLAMKSFVKK